MIASGFPAESPGDLTGSPEMDKLKSVAKCYAYIETSSNPADIDKMTNGETSSYWQSDGSARSHWIRWVLAQESCRMRVAPACPLLSRQRAHRSLCEF